MKILIPVLGFARTGGYRVLSELASAWLRQGHEVAFLSPDSSEEPYFPTRATLLWVNGNGAVGAERRNRPGPSGRYHLQALFRGLRRIGHQYDVILANQSLTAWPVALAACGGARKFYYVQAYEPEYYANTRTMRGYLLAAASALTYHLPLARIVNASLYLRHRNLRASSVVPPGIDLSIFKPTQARRKLETAETIVLGCIGRPEPEKGTIYVLRAFEELSRTDRRFLLRVAFGNLPAGWKHERCEVVVPRNDHELADYYRSLDILIAPGTAQHGAPHYPVLEGWACGVPVVTTGYMGATARTAWMVQNRDVASICDAVKEIVADPMARRQRSDEGRVVALAHSWDRVADQMLAVINDARRAR